MTDRPRYTAPMPDVLRHQMRAGAHPARSVPCGHCGAREHQTCTTPSKRHTLPEPHPGRHRDRHRPRPPRTRSRGDMRVTAADFKPHPAVHAPWMFLCSMDDPDAAVVSYAENPGAQIASALLEDVGDWHHAIKNLQRADVPPAVMTALDAFHDAVCGWVEWNERTTKKPEDGR